MNVSFLTKLRVLCDDEISIGNEEAGLTGVCTLGIQKIHCLMDR